MRHTYSHAALGICATLLVSSAAPTHGVGAQSMLVAQSQSQLKSQARASVVGSVHDSLGRKPLAGAIIQVAQLDGANPHNHTARADSLGRFRVDSVASGKYMVGFFHPLLDSLGIEPPVRELTVGRDGTFRTDLAIPSAESFRRSICGGPKSRPKSPSALLVGIVRNAKDRAVAPNATVFAEWQEVSIGSSGVVRTAPFVSTKSLNNGWFAICNVPGKGTMSIFAALGADSTERIEFDIVEGGFARRDLYLSPSVTSASPTTKTISGRIVSHDFTAPVAGAEVAVTGARSVRTNERGEFTIADAPVGTRMLEVRAVGFFPYRGPVDVVEGTPTLNLELAALKSALSTVRITAQRTLALNMSEFEFRRKTGIGKFIAETDLAKSQPVYVSDIFRFIPGVQIWTQRDSVLTRVQFRRGAFADGPCYPEFFMDGRPMGVLTVEQMDVAATPKDIKAIEIYVSPNTPPMFNNGTLGTQCGAIVIWTKSG